jgi:hypothetical protein
MKKIGLLAASIALALTGCGGSDSDSGVAPAPGGVIITGFDGYFNQAVAFQDTNNNGILDFNGNGKVDGDILFGLTDNKGQITVPKNIEGALALQTITPGGAVQTKLINGYPNEYAGKYTIDMDHPAQAMAHELVFRAPTSSNVISPITDLVAIEMAKSTNTVPVSEEKAIALVNTALGGTEEAPIDLYADFVSGDDASAELHKTAQILTESKAANPVTYEEKSTQFAEEADKIVESIVADPAQDITDPNLKPVIIDDNGTLTPIVNNKMLVDTEKLTSLDNQLTQLDQIEEAALNINLDLTSLFTDKDISSSIIPKLSTNTVTELNDANITATWSGSTLILSSYGVTSSANISLILEATDFDSSTPAIDSGIIAAELVLNIEAINQAPILDMDEFERLQKIIDGWQLQQGELVSQTLDITNLFADSDGNVVEFRSGGMTADGLLILPKTGTSPIISIDGSPAKAHDKHMTSFTVGVADEDNAENYIEFLLPEITAGTPPPVVAHPLEDKNWYVLESGSSDGDSDDDNDYSRVWCDTFRFEDNIVLSNKRTLTNKNTCSETGLVQEESGTYKVDGENIIVTFILQEENDDGIVEDITETSTISIKNDKNAPIDVISKGAKSILYTNTGDEEGQFEYSSAIYFADKADAEKRINVLSSDEAVSRDAPIYWPGEKEGEYILRSTSLQMSVGVADKENSSDDITVWINGVSCDGLLSQAESGDPAIFEKLFVTSDSISADSISADGSHNAIYAIEQTCNTVMEGKEGEVQTPSAAIALIFGTVEKQLNIDESYSIIGYISDEWSGYISDINFNMTWDGKTNNE